MFHKWIHISTLRRKMFFSFTGLFLTALFILQLVNTVQSYTLLKEKLTDSVHQSLTLGLSNIDYYLEDADNLASGMIIEPELQQSLTETFNYDSLDTKLMLRTLERTIKKYSSSRPYIHKVYTVNESGDILDNSLNGMEIPSFQEGTTLDLSPLHPAPYITSSPPVVSIRKDIFSLDSMNEKKGMLIIDIDFRVIKEIIRNFALPMEGKVLLLSPQYECLAQSGIESISDKEVTDFLQRNGTPKQNAIVRILGKSYICLTETSKISGWHLISLIPQSLFARSTALQLKVTLLLFVLCITVSVIISRNIMSYLYEPLDMLMASMKRAEIGDFDGQIAYHRKDELQSLIHGYNAMLSRIRGLIEDVTNKERSKQQAELYALQAQINPHFLYNTLNSIRYLAKVHQAQDIRDTTTALIRLSRASLDSHRFITIAQELELVKDYLLIQSLRYGQIAAFHCPPLPSSAADCLLPRFSIQPLVENALFHGILPKGSGNIYLQMTLEEHSMTITVTDDGIGIKPDELRQINATLLENTASYTLQEDTVKPQKLKNIGVDNINLRIKLHFSADYGLILRSAEEGGIQAIMTIPIVKETADEKDRTDR